MNYEAITSILNDGLVLATGCTEPGALALTAAAAAAHLGEEVKSIHTFASGNIIKNAYSAGIPGTALVGIEYAVAIGAIVAQPEKQLQVINGITSEQLEKACALVDAKAVKVELAKVPEKLYIEVEVKGEHNTAKAMNRATRTAATPTRTSRKSCRLPKSLSTPPPSIFPCWTRSA